MTIDYRIRNIVIAAALAAAAVLADGPLRDLGPEARRDAGKQSVTVYVPTQELSARDGRHEASPATSRQQTISRTTLPRRPSRAPTRSGTSTRPSPSTRASS